MKCATSSRRNRCFYCRKGSATAWCCDRRCRRFFHVACGMKNNCLFKFRGEFVSFCDRHHDIDNSGHYIHNQYDECFICWEPIGEYNPLTSIPSCCNQGWFHRNCMKQAALVSALELHCPLCGYDKRGYRKLARDHGIFVPHQDAAWERSVFHVVVYDEFLGSHYRCDLDCVCPRGRYFDYGPWKLVICIYCGGFGAHWKCLPVPERTDDYICHTCSGRPTFFFGRRHG